MNLSQRVRGLRLKVNTAMGYPMGSMALALLLIFLSPFVSSYLCYGALLLCVYRVVRHNSAIFAADYCVLLPLFHLFRGPNGMSLQVYLCLFAAVWYLIRGSVKVNSSVVWFLLLMNYLLARMQLHIPNFLLCFGQIFLLFVLMPGQTPDSAVRTLKLLCYSVLLASVYTLLLRNTGTLRAVLGSESLAMQGVTARRFQGPFSDPNYYMLMLLVVLTVVLRLRDSGHLRLVPFLILAISFTCFGILTYSKTFLVVFLLLLFLYVLWQFAGRKLLWGCVLTVLMSTGVAVLLFADFSPFALILARLSSASSLSELTTGRTTVYADYLEIITQSVPNFLFGKGLAAEGLVKHPHNLYIEIMYYAGAVGLILLIGFFFSLVYHALSRQRERQNIFDKYIVLFIALVLFFTLHGMFSSITYCMFFVSMLSMLVPKIRKGEI